MKSDITEYFRTISKNLFETQNHIRNIIGDKHWPTDGSFKEASLRKTLRDFLPESFLIGTGFVYTEEKVSNQIDIIIIDKNSPTLFKDGDLLIVTPDCVDAIIEVKTRARNSSEFRNYCTQLEENLEFLRTYKTFLPSGNYDHSIWGGLFIYDGFEPNIPIADILKETSKDKTEREINCVSMGLNQLAYYKRTREWKACNFTGYENFENTAPVYFMNHMITQHLGFKAYHSHFRWFPMREFDVMKD